MQNFENYGMYETSVKPKEENKKHIINLLIQKRDLFTNKSFPQTMDYKLIQNNESISSPIFQNMLNSYNMIGLTI